MVSESKIKQKAIKFDKMSYDRLQKALDVASSQIDDLSYPLNEIGERFLRERSFIFDRTRSSAGAYEDLSERYKNLNKKNMVLSIQSFSEQDVLRLLSQARGAKTSSLLALKLLRSEQRFPMRIHFNTGNLLGIFLPVLFFSLGRRVQGLLPIL